MGVVNVMFQDAQHIIEVVMQIVFYLTPIIYPPQMLLDKLAKSHLEWLINLNPFAVLLDLIRAAAAGGPVPFADACGDRLR